jgi:hypothetical protein
MAPPLAGNVVGSVGANFVVAEWKDDAGGPPWPPRWIASLHLHRNDDEAWYVLEGALCVRGEGHRLGAGRLWGFCAAGDAAHLLESGAGAGPAPARDDVEYLFADSGYSCDDESVSGAAAGGV